MIRGVNNARSSKSSPPLESARITLDQLSLMAELATDLVIKTSLDGTIEWVSPSVTAVLGWEPEEVTGRSTFEFVHPDDLAGAQIYRARVDAGETIENYLTRLRAKNGVHRWMSIRPRAITDEQGFIVARVIGVHDIHRETTARKALHTLSRGNGVLVRANDEADLLQSMCDTIAEAGPYLFAWYLRPVHDSKKSVEVVASSSNDRGYRKNFTATWDDSSHGQGPTGTALRTGQTQLSKDFLNDPLTKPWARAAKAAGIRSSITLPVFVDGRLDGVLNVYGSGTDEFDQEAMAPLTDLADALGYGLSRLRGQARLHMIVDSLMDAHVLLEPIHDEAGQIVDFTYLDANQIACDAMKMDRYQIVGATLLDFLPGHAETGPLPMYANVMETGQPLALDNYPYDNEILGSVTFSDIRAIRVNDALSVTWRDVTNRYAQEVALAASEEQYRLLAENSTDVVLRLHLGLIGWISPSITDMLGWTQSDLVGRNLDELLMPEDLGNFLECKASMQDGHLHVTRFRMLAKDLTYHWVEIRAKPYLDGKGERDGAVASFHTIDTQVAAEESLQRRARYDELTGLLNRNDMLEQLSAMNSRTQRTGEEIAVLFCDVDEFKNVNDSNGHAIGDQVLRSIASRIEGSVRRGDLIARIGGDEFLVILDGVHDLDEAVRIAEKLRRRVARPIHVTSGVITATLSIGVTLARADDDVHTLIARADQAMYKAKRAGSDQVIAISPE